MKSLFVLFILLLNAQNVKCYWGKDSIPDDKHSSNQLILPAHIADSTYLPARKVPGWDSLQFLFGRWDPSPSESNPAGIVCYRRPASGKTLYNITPGFRFYNNGSADLLNGAYSIEMKWGLINNADMEILLMTPSGEPVMTFDLIRLQRDLLALRMNGVLSTAHFQDSVYIVSSVTGGKIYKGGWRVPGTEDASQLLDRYRLGIGYAQFMPEEEYRFKNFFINAGHRSSGFDRFSSKVKVDFAFELGINVLLGIDEEENASYIPFLIPYVKFGPELRIYRGLFLSACFGLAGATYYYVFVAPVLGTNLFYLLPISGSLSLELETGFHISFFEGYLGYLSAGISF